MTAQNLVYLITAVCGVFTTVGGIILYLFRSIFGYLLKRVETLENQQATALAKLVEVAESQQTAITETGKLAVQLMEDRRFAERERHEGRRP